MRVSRSKASARSIRRRGRWTRRARAKPYATYAFAAQICELNVDLELGTVAVLRIVAAHDVGCAVNPTLVEGQIHGGIAQGLGTALMEEFVPGHTENLHDYLIPTVGDMPQIDIRLIRLNFESAATPVRSKIWMTCLPREHCGQNIGKAVIPTRWA